MKIKLVPYIKGTPARTNRRTGIIYVSKFHFDKLDAICQQFIIFHEMAHYLFQTKDEQLCDEFATEMLLKNGVRLKKIFKSINSTLSNSNMHYGRKLNILNKLRIHDFIQNNNAKALTKLN